MIEGTWKGANEASYGDCEICGDKRKRRVIHYVGKGKVPMDHLFVCESCFVTSNMKDWHACGCGG